MTFRAQLRPAFLMLVLLTVVTGIAYPVAVTAVSQLAFPARANGSLLIVDGHAVGSSLIGQPFDDPRYFWGRLSATSPVGFNGAASSGSNLGPMSDGLLDAARTRREALRAADPGNIAPVPVDLVTASGSGLDPHISPAAARYQVARVARVRGVAADRVAALVEGMTEGRTFGVLGEPRVNVLALNRALDGLATR
jgi:K+-transporting ATPase ATPase C chain